MTSDDNPTGASSTSFLWNNINWTTVEKQVHRLQMRIAKAVREKRDGKVKALQWILTHSQAAKLLAVKRVTSNQGRHTSGVDNVLWRGSKQKWVAANAMHRRGYSALPLRRIYIPKKDGSLRPSPCDRILVASVKNYAAKINDAAFVILDSLSGLSIT